MIFSGRVTLTDSFDTIFVSYNFMLHFTRDNGGGANPHLRQVLESRGGGQKQNCLVNNNVSRNSCKTGHT